MNSVVAHAISSSTRRVGTASTNVLVREVSLPCGDGITIAGQLYTSAHNNSLKTKQQPHRVLCLHGWLDNCHSFSRLAPRLVEHYSSSAPRDVELVAIDFPGHGKSSHKPVDGPQVVLSEMIYYVAEAVRQLEWTRESEKFSLIGHSMGASLASLYAASFPEQIRSLVLLDGAGPLSRPARDIAKHVRQHVLRRQTVSNKPPRVYPSIEQAVETRCQTARNFPGNQWLSTEAARDMVERATIVEESGGVRFVHDPRMQWPSVQYFTDEQTISVFKDIQCATALLLARDGWPFPDDQLKQVLDVLLPTKFEKLPGSHHFHADPDSYHRVAEEIVSFLLEM
ncbi:hypothetical protein FisN_20Lh254 [Fistulifera solaris]|uniref:AB hydrolase-1 domain-containing protein n=1 Tax=Fistulifera solaris TaxID=1519565 RepID=A0A1Z5KRI7_FISSO|nr:hypothetical protein FisN_20Lh254 [Fistulifera solaris]|eukprot:GAX28933.1 hypothetical protein FisN_20Lh254 [Fistulifera solaris]